MACLLKTALFWSLSYLEPSRKVCIQLGMAARTLTCLSVPQVSDWWEEYIYLRGRGPLMVNSNYYAMVSWSPFLLQSRWVCPAGCAPWLPGRAQDGVLSSCSCFCCLSLPVAVKSPPGPHGVRPSVLCLRSPPPDSANTFALQSTS